MAETRKPPKSPKKRRGSATPSSEVSPRVARRERRRDRSREEIIDAARRVVLRDGIAATTLEAVAREVGLTKAALYYYFPSKDAIYFELIFGAVETQYRAVHEAVAKAESGTDALRAIIAETVRSFSSRLDDFRLAFLYGQVAGPDAVRLSDEQLARIRPLNELAFGGTAKLLSDDWQKNPDHAQVEPRMMAFLANLAAMGLLTMKGMVESVGDPLRYSDEQLIEGFARVFEAAAAPVATKK